jgi:shikimate dehydrogenase
VIVNQGLNREVYASISSPNVSVTPVMYNAAFQALGLDFVYVSFDVTDLTVAIEALRALNIRGYSVSMPFKRAVLPLLDELEPVAREIGAVNIVKNCAGRLHGFNSDWIGAVKAIGKYASVRGKQAAVLGAGGAGRAVSYGLKSHGARVVLYNRTVERALAASQELGVGFGGGLDNFEGIRQADVVVNATPVGSLSCPGQELLPAGVLRPGQVVLDAVFYPLQTDLVLKAGRASCTAVQGFEMLVQQAAVTFELFTGIPAPVETMLDALLSTLRALG